MVPNPELKPSQEAPPQWWGDAAIAALLWFVYTYLDRNSLPEALPKPQYFIAAFFVLAAAWHAFLYKVFLLGWLMYRVEKEEDDLGDKIAELPPDEARKKALDLLKDPLRFQCVPGPSSYAGNLPRAAKEVFALYGAVQARDCPEDVWLDPVKAAETAPPEGFVSLGEWYGENVLFRRLGGDAVYEGNWLENNDSGRERRSLPTLFHWIIFAAGRLEHEGLGGSGAENMAAAGDKK